MLTFGAFQLPRHPSPHFIGGSSLLLLYGSLPVSCLYCPQCAGACVRVGDFSRAGFPGSRDATEGPSGLRKPRAAVDPYRWPVPLRVYAWRAQILHLCVTNSCPSPKILWWVLHLPTPASISLLRMRYLRGTIRSSLSMGWDLHR